MESMLLDWKLTSAVAVVVIILLIILMKKTKTAGVAVDLPPGPKKLPVIGNLHLISQPPFRCLRDLAKVYGPIMHVKLGEVDTVVVSSPQVAKEIMKDNDPVFTNRPESIALKIFWYNYSDVAFSPYGGYWRQMRKITTEELAPQQQKRALLRLHPRGRGLSSRRIPSHEDSTRRSGIDEDLVDVLLRIKNQGDLQFPIGYDNIKAVLFGMFAGGTETSSSTVEWTMTELMRNPRVMAKAQAEVRRQVATSASTLKEEDIPKLSYLKLVIMETLRLHPQGAIIARVSREQRQIGGYTIPEKLRVIINVWAIQRDPKYWEHPETFEPERFLNQPSLDFTGSDFRYLPFGSGKRVCPGIAFGWVSVVLPLAHLLYNFNWKLPNGVQPHDLNMNENMGVTSSRKENLYVVATPYQPMLKS